MPDVQQQLRTYFDHIAAGIEERTLPHHAQRQVNESRIESEPAFTAKRERRSERRQAAIRLGAACAALVIAFTMLIVVVRIVAGDRSPSTVRARSTTGHVTTYRDETHRFVAQYPSSWRRAARPLASSPADAKEILSLGNFPLRRGTTTCPYGPQNAISDIPPNGVLISVQERRDRMLYPERRSFPPSGDGALAARSQQDSFCLTGTTTEHWRVSFDDEGRSFDALVVFGLQANDRTHAKAWGVLNSLKVEPIGGPARVPNDVSEELYSTQALGATAVLTLPDYSYETAIRVDDHICLELRVRGAPSGPGTCEIPARGPWAEPVIARTVQVNGSLYVIGVATDAIETVSFASNQQEIPMVRRQPFPTLQFLRGADRRAATRASCVDGRRR